LVIARPHSVTAPFSVRWVRRSEVTRVRYRMVASSRTKRYEPWQAAGPRVKGQVRTSTDSFEEPPDAGTLLALSHGCSPVPATGGR
jgi:hypothetical protein